MTNVVAGNVPTDFDTATSHTIIVRETLVGASNSPRDTVLTINVNDMGDTPVLAALTLSSNTIIENSMIGTTVGTIQGKTSGSTLSLTANVGNKFTISGLNIVTIATLDYETATSHAITVREVLAGAANTPRDTNFTINVQDFDETAPATLNVLTLSADDILENSVENTVVGTLQGKTSGSTLLLTGHAGNRFKLSGLNIVAGPQPTDYEASTTHSIIVQETLAGATNSPLSTPLTINVQDFNETGPVTLNALTLSSSTIAEDVPIGTVVGVIQNRTAGSTLSLTANVGNKFTISGTNIATIAALDYEIATSHAITVREVLAGATNTPRDTNLTINVTDVDIGPFTLTWTSPDTELVNPTFTLTPSLLEGDSITIYFDNNDPVTTPFTFDTNIIDAAEAVAGSINFPGITTPLPTGVPTYCFAYIVRPGGEDRNTNTVSRTLTAGGGGDTLAPVLSSPTGIKTGATTATLTVSTINDSNGTLYGVSSAVAPTPAQIKAGQNSAGLAASYAFNQPVSTTGVQTKNATGLTPSTTYTMHYMHEDAATNQSNVASVSSPFTTDAAGAYAMQLAGFDGATKSYANLYDLAGIPDSTQATMSVWFKNTETGLVPRSIIAQWGGSKGIFVWFPWHGKFYVRFGDAASAEIATFEATTDNYRADHALHHALISINGTTLQVYIDDVPAVGSVTTGAGGAINFLNGIGAVACDMDGGSLWLGDLGDLWVMSGTALDFSNVTNRRKFRDASGNPVDLGVNGSTPTGAQPHFFYSGAVANWLVNKGVATATFTQTGTVTNSGTYP